MVSPNEVNTRIKRLHAIYGDFPVEYAEHDLTSDNYERARECHDRGVPGATRVWVERNGTTLLVREESRPDSWGVAGGLIDPGEHADHAGEREVHEETGIECEIIDIAYVHRATIHPEDNGRDFDEIAVAAIGEYVRGETQPEDGEIRQVQWWKRLPENVHSPASRIGANRLE